MITEKDLQEAIAECQGVRNPTANTCIKLAAYLTILNYMNNENGPEGYSTAPQSVLQQEGSIIPLLTGSEFLERIGGRKAEDVLPILDELVEAVSVYNPRLYNSFMMRL